MLKKGNVLLLLPALMHFLGGETCAGICTYGSSVIVQSTTMPYSVYENQQVEIAISVSPGIGSDNKPIPLEVTIAKLYVTRDNYDKQEKAITGSFERINRIYALKFTYLQSDYMKAGNQQQFCEIFAVFETAKGTNCANFSYRINAKAGAAKVLYPPAFHCTTADVVIFQLSDQCIVESSRHQLIVNNGDTYSMTYDAEPKSKFSIDVNLPSCARYTWKLRSIAPDGSIVDKMQGTLYRTISQAYCDYLQPTGGRTDYSAAIVNEKVFFRTGVQPGVSVFDFVAICGLQIVGKTRRDFALWFSSGDLPAVQIIDQSRVGHVYKEAKTFTWSMYWTFQELTVLIGGKQVSYWESKKQGVAGGRIPVGVFMTLPFATGRCELKPSFNDAVDYLQQKNGGMLYIASGFNNDEYYYTKELQTEIFLWSLSNRIKVNGTSLSEMPELFSFVDSYGQRWYTITLKVLIKPSSIISAWPR